MASPYVVHYAVDWTRVLDDLAHLLGEADRVNPDLRIPATSRVMAEQLSIPRGTLRGWLDGSEPKHSDGEHLLDRWCRLTGRSREVVPLVRRSLSGHER